MKKCAVIINPTSGKGKSLEKIREIEQTIREHGYQCQIYITGYKGHAKELIEQISPVDLVISVGGDGTFNEVMQGNFLREKRLLLAHIPFGTANDIGAMYGYTKNIVKNLKMVLEGKVKKIDICTINGTPFTYCAALGKFTSISYDTSKRLKKRLGYVAYLTEGLKEINSRTKLYDIKYTIDEKEIHQGKYSIILISNANRVAGINIFSEDVLLDDNQFEAIFCNCSSRKEFLKALVHITRNEIDSYPGFEFYKVKKLEMELDKKPSKGWSIDGEEYEEKSLKYTIDIVRNVEIMLPLKNIDKLFLDKR